LIRLCAQCRHERQAARHERRRTEASLPGRIIDVTPKTAEKLDM